MPLLPADVPPPRAAYSWRMNPIELSAAFSSIVESSSAFVASVDASLREMLGEVPPAIPQPDANYVLR